MVCVSLYNKERRYGGPEEGGWYYDYMEYVETVAMLPDPKMAAAFRDKINEDRDSILTAVVEREPKLLHSVDKPVYQ